MRFILPTMLLSFFAYGSVSYASFNCRLEDLGRLAEKGFQCKSITGEKVCIRIESSAPGRQVIQVKNESDSYNQYFQETVNSSACQAEGSNQLRHCRMSRVRVDAASIFATTSSLDFGFNSIYRAAVTFDTLSLKGQFNLLSRSGFQNDDWLVQDAFDSCTAID